MSQAPNHDELPVPDYDQLPLGSLQARIRSLGAEGVQALLSYEQSHGDRLPVVQVLRRRLEDLEAGAEPTDGDPTARTPETAQAPQGGSRVHPETQGPPQNAPTGGDPTNPTQPRR